ncbi:MAG: LysR family transcriptional regulator [Haliea sp.]|uniref:LysR family transcriptional regulator n=1 Tax=Haliea sp. TaxID=1932666 RepID=UPI0032EF3DEE
MDITIKQLRAFVAVARSRSFAEACGVLNLSQPALSVTIRNLEEAVGGRLLARTTRTLALTPEGSQFLPVAQRLLADWSAALEDLHDTFALRRGRLAIASMPSFASTTLPDLLQRFRQLHPEINITVHDVIAEDVVAMVRSGRVEAGIAFDPGMAEDLQFTPLFSDRFVAALPAGHPLLRRRQLRWSALGEEPFIALQHPSSIRSLLEQSLAASGISLRIEVETNHLVTIGRMVASGLGVSAMPTLCRQQLRELGVHTRPLLAPVIERRVGIVTRRRYPLSGPASALVSILRDHYAGEQLEQASSARELEI